MMPGASGVGRVTLSVGRLDSLAVARRLDMTGGDDPLAAMVAAALRADGLDAGGWSGGVIDRALAHALALRIAGDADLDVAAATADSILLLLSQAHHTASHPLQKAASAHRPF